ERPVLVHFIADLAISIVQGCLQEGDAIGLGLGLPRLIVAPDLRPPGMTAATRFHLGARREWCRALGNGLARRERPAPCRDCEWGDQPRGGIRHGVALLRVAGPRHVTRTRTVTCLTGHVHLRPGGLETLPCEPVVLLQASRVTVSTHKVPILEWTSPVE